MSWEYRVTINITIYTKQRMSEPEAEQTAIDAIYSTPEGIQLFKRETISVEERSLE